MRSKYKTLMIKESLYQELDLLCRSRGFKTTSELLNYLIQREYQESNNTKNQLFNTDDFNPYHNLNEQYRKKKENENN